MSGTTIRLLLALAWLCASISVSAQQASHAEAQGAIDAFWSKKLTRCGDSLFTKFQSGNLNQMKNGVWSVEPRALSQSDVLNGVQWRGITKIQGAATRAWVDGRGWLLWSDGVFGNQVFVTKANGRWDFTLDPYGATDKMTAPACRDLPPEGAMSNAQITIVRANNAPAACHEFFVGFPKDMDIVRSLQQGLNPKTCRGSMKAMMFGTNDPPRDQEGITPLIAFAYYCHPFGVRELLAAGSDVNAKSTTGKTALDYASMTLTHDFMCREIVDLLKSAGGKSGR